MRKQILVVMLGLSVVLSGCSSQSTESMLQEVKKDAKEIKSGKLTTSMSSTDKVNKPIGYNISGDEKFDQIEYNLKGTFKQDGKDSDVEVYTKDGVEYLKFSVGSRYRWAKSKLTQGSREPFNFKKNAYNMQDSILNLLDNKDNWDVAKDGDKVIFRLKKTDELKNKVKEERSKKTEKKVKYSDFDYTIEYVFNTKTNDVEKLVYELNSKGKNISDLFTAKGTLEEINKEVKVILPEESKSAREVRE